MEGLGALADAGGQIGGLGVFADDPVAILEARRRQMTGQGAATNPFEAILAALGPTLSERSMAQVNAMRGGRMAIDPTLALDMAGMAGTTRGPIRAYHGSPHNFDRFDLSKIGTGEGNQAYGRGLYFAENEGVARSYREALTDPWKQWYAGNPNRPADGSVAQRIADIFHNDGVQFSRGSRRIDEVADRLGATRSTADNMDQYTFKDGSRLLIADSGWDVAGPHNPGSMYEVDIHADPRRFLEWDSPIEQQPGEVRNALRDAIARSEGGDDMANYTLGGIGRSMDLAERGLRRDPLSGRQIYEELERLPGGDATASSLLREHGIPGIRYLDAGSRQGAGGTSNYVVFDDALIEILRKYGILAPTAGAAGLGALAGEDEGL